MATVTKMHLPLSRAPHLKSKSSLSGKSFIYFCLVVAVFLFSKMLLMQFALVVPQAIDQQREPLQFKRWRICVLP